MWLQVKGDQPKVQENDSAEVRKIIEQVPEYQKNTGGVEGDFDLHTGLDGFGQRVSKEMIVFFIHRYNVPEEHIDELMRQSSTDGLLKSQKVLTSSPFSPKCPENRHKMPTRPSLTQPWPIGRPEIHLPPPIPNPVIPPTPQSPAPPRTPPGTPPFPPFQGDVTNPSHMPGPNQNGKK